MPLKPYALHFRFSIFHFFILVVDNGPRHAKKLRLLAQRAERA